MTFSKVCNVSDMSISEIVEANVISFLDWGFIDKGGFINVDVPKQGAYSSDLSVLDRYTDPRDKSVYFRGNEGWIYQSYVSNQVQPYYQPLIYVDGVQATSSVINYKDGTVTITPTPATTSVVQAKYSYKFATVGSSRKILNKKTLGYKNKRGDKRETTDGILPEILVPMPFLSVEVPPISSSRPFGLDRLGPRIYTINAQIAVISETPSETARISDIICNQQGTNFKTFNPKSIVQSNDFPLNFNGTLNSGKTHDQLAQTYPWYDVYFEEVNSYNGNYISQDIFQSFIKLKLELVTCSNCL